METKVWFCNKHPRWTVIREEVVLPDPGQPAPRCLECNEPMECIGAEDAIALAFGLGIERQEMIDRYGVAHEASANTFANFRALKEAFRWTT